MKVSVYLPDETFRNARARRANLSRTLRDALEAMDKPGAPQKTPETLIRHARILVQEAHLRNVRGPIHLVLEDLADELEKRL